MSGTADRQPPVSGHHGPAKHTQPGVSGVTFQLTMDNLLSWGCPSGVTTPGLMPGPSQQMGGQRGTDFEITLAFAF